MCFFFSSCFLFGLYSSTFPSSCCVVSAGCGNQRMEGGKLSNLSIANDNIQYFCLHICQIFLFLFFYREWNKWVVFSVNDFQSELKMGVIKLKSRGNSQKPLRTFCRKLEVWASSLAQKVKPHLEHPGGGKPHISDPNWWIYVGGDGINKLKDS